MLLSLVALLSFGFGLRNIDNYINWLYFPLSLLGIGAFLGLVLYAVWSFFLPTLKTYKNTNNISAMTLIVVICSMLTFGIGAWYNEYEMSAEECHVYTIESLSESSGKQVAYYVFINRHGKTERYSFGKAFNQTHHAGDKVQLCLVKGGLGYEYYRLDE